MKIYQRLSNPGIVLDNLHARIVGTGHDGVVLNTLKACQFWIGTIMIFIINIILSLSNTIIKKLLMQYVIIQSFGGEGDC